MPTPRALLLLICPLLLLSLVGPLGAPPSHPPRLTLKPRTRRPRMPSVPPSPTTPVTWTDSPARWTACKHPSTPPPARAKPLRDKRLTF